MSMNSSKVLAIASIVAALAGCAGTPEAPSVASQEIVAPAHCLRYTGTHIAVPEGSCVAHAGQVYTIEDIRRTGAAGTADALRVLGAF